MLVLASRSPRRAEILRQSGIPFVVRTAPVDETPQRGERPEDCVRRLAALKALAVPCAADEVVLGADTTVVIDGDMLGKPAGAAEARRMLAALSGRATKSSPACACADPAKLSAIGPPPASGSPP